MKIASVVTVLCGFLFGQCAYAEEAKIPPRPHWVIIATVVDQTTGEQLRQGKLGGRELEFDDPDECNAILGRVQPFADGRVAVVLACRKVDSSGVTL
jgi:hypothetical protein